MADNRKKYGLLLVFLLAIFSSASAEDDFPAYSGTLPVLHIETFENQPITSKETYLPATCYLDALGLDGYESVGSKEHPARLQIRGRGNWTWESFEKKSYRLKFDEKLPLMGLKKNRHFALLAHADDGVGFLRNTIGFELSRRMGLDWTPEQQPVEVMLNGEYIGLYFLTENIRVGNNRVNIAEQADYETDETKITGGWLVEIDNHPDENQIQISVADVALTSLRLTYHSPENLSTQQKNYLTNQFKSIKKAVYTAEKSSTAWEELIDIDALARFYVVSEAIDHIEAFYGSCYLHKDFGQTKWTFGPVWDFGHAFNNFHSKQKFIYDYPEWGHCIVEEIAKFPRFQAQVRKVWKEFCTEAYPTIEQFIDDFAGQIEAAAASNARRWPQYGNADEKAMASLVKERFREKMAWLAVQWGDFTPIDKLRPDGANSPRLQPVDYDISGKRFFSPGIRITTVPTADGGWKNVKIMGKFGQ